MSPRFSEVMYLTLSRGCPVVRDVRSCPVMSGNMSGDVRMMSGSMSGSMSDFCVR